MTKATQSNPTPAQVTMTLAAIAATAATPRPSGETLQEQSLRAMRGVTAQLNDSTLATRGTWRLKWLALSPDNANLAYIAWNSDGSNQFAVAVRGTIDNPTDMMEDLDVGTVVPFTAGGSRDAAVSAGAMAAFTQVATARSITDMPVEQAPEGQPGAPDTVVPSGATFTQALAGLLAAVPSTPQPTVYVTGHSLGGCIATMLATYLQAQTWTVNKPQFALVTFAAPTAGLKSFADYVDSRPWSLNERHVNAYDLVPRAWSDLSTPKGWYPAPGPSANEEVKLLLTVIDLLRKANVYVQPSAPSTVNANYSMYDKELVNKTTSDFLGQVAFQHANSTYLTLLGAPVVSAGPVVTAVQPTAGKGGTQVIINGSGFGGDSVVDFGPIPCADFHVDSDRQITAVAPDGTGLVGVRVTTMLGTSPAVPLGQFAYDNGPAPVVVSAVAPRSGKAGTQVTITGSGFAPGATVWFKDKKADPVTVVSPTAITATVPSRLPDPNTVDVTVTVGVATSPTGPADEFTYAG
ncbi:IPT/TIG domain-containing protein [Streptomyces sp. PKU-EA00015]|uniref:IPT/TIG domain-containing protein n=1 Tax=Streptomyces sp. PKU-EA00015 TaxID=2748326 RepID=UPI0015A46CC0|nr:IPT/TIG domain-containing protein [Streptomyces sp. PKU-EA00015]NWF29498.1 IPT/TIG domain-containing protein [Streptomyces sp. PKU-EA00015]